MTTLSKLSFQEKGHGLFFLKKERHAQESMVKKKLDTRRSKYSKEKKRVGHLKVQVFKKRDSEREIAHVQRKRNKGERWSMKGFHTPSTKN